MKPITPRQETAIAIAATAVMLLIILLTSCTTTKSITETEVVRDTVTLNHHDTVTLNKYLTLHDTVSDIQYHYITLNDKGDPIKEVHIHDNKETVRIVDSTYRYKAEMDSMQRLLDKQHDQLTVKEQGGGVKRWEIALYAAILIVFMGVLKIK